MIFSVEDFIRRDAEKLMETDREYARAKERCLETERDLMSMLTLEPAMEFVRYQEERSKLERERIRVWLKAVYLYYGRRVVGSGEEED